MNVFRIIWTNREWLFSGIGAVIVLGLASLLWRKFVQPKSEPSNPEQEFYLDGNAAERQASRWWCFLEGIPGFRRIAWKRLYSNQTIAKRIRVWVRGEGEGMTFWKIEDHGRLNVWLDVVNLNPFPVTIDRITGHATTAGAPVVAVQSVDPHEVPGPGTKDIHVEFPLSSSDIQQISFQLKHRPDAPAGLNLKVYVLSELGRLTLDRQLSTGNRAFMNFGVQENRT